MVTNVLGTRLEFGVNPLLLGIGNEGVIQDLPKGQGSPGMGAMTPLNLGNGCIGGLRQPGGQFYPLRLKLRCVFGVG